MRKICVLRTHYCPQKLPTRHFREVCTVLAEISLAMTQLCRRAFSLLEILVVIIIVSVMLTLALPDMLGNRQTSYLKTATDDVIDIFHYAKTRAGHAFTAYGVQYRSADGGVLEVFRGTRPDCGSVTYAGTPLKQIHFKAPTSVGGSWNIQSGRQIQIEQVLPADISQVCFTPDGRFVNASNSQPIPSTLEGGNYAAGEYIITLSRYGAKGPEGLRHHVIVSYSGRARFTFGKDHTTSDGEGY